MTANPPTLSSLEQLDMLIASAVIHVDALRDELADAVAVLEQLRATQARMVQLYNRHAAGPLVEP